MSRTIFVLVMAGLALAGCPSIGNETGTCSSNETCTCNILGNCEKTCPAGSCHFRCLGTGNCVFDCAGGNCDVSCENTGTCTLTCPGDDCRKVCKGSGVCLIKSCTKGCPQDAGLDVGRDVSADRPRDAPLKKEAGKPDAPKPDKAAGDTLFTVDTKPDGPCSKVTCAQLGKSCGSVSDGCGGQLDCGASCPAGSCGGGGTAGVCGCKTTTTDGPQSPTAATNSASSGAVAWTAPEEVYKADAGTGTPPSGVASVHLLTGSTPSNLLVAAGFGLSLPGTAMINGIQVEVLRQTGAASGGTVADQVLRLVSGSTALTANRASITPWTGTWTYAKYGGPADLWGRIWTPAEVNDPAFGVALAVRLSGAATGDDALVDHVRLSVYYANACCAAKTCAGSGFNCGTLDDGCGVTLTCGTCPTGQPCLSNKCCVAKTCTSAGYVCGTLDDGCGTTLTCGSCPSGNPCVQGKCACSDGIKNGNEGDVDCGGGCATKCSQGKTCASGDCAVGLSCVDGVCCNSPCTGPCRACVSFKTGAPNGTCADITDATDPDAECTESLATSCGQTGVCKAGLCALWASGTVCAPAGCAGSTESKADTCNGQGLCVDGGSTTCAAPYVCGTTTCQSCTDGAMNGSETDLDCGGATATCQRCAVGKKCLAGSDCAAGAFCVDGVCCSSACTDVCRRCDIAGSVGTCSPIADSDPDNECPGPKNCVAGACAN